jgi:LuxR family maltose regulon positive regulatory protein
MAVGAEVTHARVRFAEGRFAEAYRCLRTARDQVAAGGVPDPLRRVLSLVEAELRVAGGDPPGARRWFSDWCGDEPFPAWAAVVRAAILLTEGKAAAAAGAVDPYLSGTGPESSVTWRLHAGIVSALAGQALGLRNQVLRGLDVALAAAEEEGFRQPFVSGGPELRRLISSGAPGLPVYRSVVAELTAGPGAPSPATRPRTADAVVEPLTERELAVLRYLPTPMSNDEIASALYVSVNTVKTHLKNLYRKLHSRRRREAVRRGHDLGLI